MTNRERFINCATGKPIDRTPVYIMFGPWSETEAKWREQGVKNPATSWREDFDMERCVHLGSYVQHHFCPAIKQEILERRGRTVIMRDWLGQIVECIEGHSTIPRIIESPVKSFADWKKIREERLDPNKAERFPSDWQALAEKLNSQDVPVQMGTYPMGLYGTLRDLMGVEESLLAFYDDPELVKEIMDSLTDYFLALYEKICKDVRVDIIQIWEDMSGKQGSLISPEFIKKYMLPNYRRIKAFADSHDIPVIQVDTDGNCDELIPLFHEGGVNMILPLEVMAGCDVVEMRKKFPYMSMLGGIDKNMIALGKKEIDRELERIEPLMGRPGYFPSLDHLIPPEVSYENYTYFINRLIQMSREKRN